MNRCSESQNKGRSVTIDVTESWGALSYQSRKTCSFHQHYIIGLFWSESTFESVFLKRKLGAEHDEKARENSWLRHFWLYWRKDDSSASPPVVIVIITKDECKSQCVKLGTHYKIHPSDFGQKCVSVWRVKAKIGNFWRETDPAWPRSQSSKHVLGQVRTQLRSVNWTLLQSWRSEDVYTAESGGHKHK